MGNILVTGGCGFIGSHIVEELLKVHNITIIDNFNDYYDPKLKEINWGYLQKVSEDFNKNRDLILIRENILDINKGKINLNDQNFDYIIHLAAQAGVRESINNPELYYRQNVLGTKSILEFSKKNDIKLLINFSSSSVYGNQPIYPLKESFMPKPISPYAETKLKAEQLCNDYCKKYNLPIATIRPFSVYGPRQRPTMAINTFFKNLANGLPIEVFGDGTKQRDFTYVTDIVEAIKLILRSKFDSNHEIFNIGSSKPISVNSLINLISRILKIQPKIIFKADAPGDVDITYASIEKARLLLKYEPKISISKGLQYFWKWFQELGNLN